MGKSRKKKSTLSAYRQANVSVRLIGKLEWDLLKLQKEGQSKIEQAKKELVKKTAKVAEQIKAETKALEQFAKDNKDGKKMSIELASGVIGWRVSSAISVGKKTIALIKKYYRKTAERYIRVTETVDKNALARMKVEALEKIDARRKLTKRFFVEPHKARLGR